MDTIFPIFVHYISGTISAYPVYCLYIFKLEEICITVVKGDGKYMSIAAASILAKTHRDEYMLHLHQEHPQYAWDRNKGYPSAAHRAAIRMYGPTPYHRMTFNLTGDSPQMEFDF